MSEQAKFLEGNLMRHIAVMSVASSVGLMAVFAVDFVDMIFISMLGKAELAAAVGYAGAILFFTGPLSLLWFFNGVIFVANAAFNNLGHPFYSTLTNWGRHTIGTIPFVMVFAAYLGAPGVLIGQAVGGIIFAVLSYLVAKRVISETAGEVPAAREPFARQARLFQLFHHRR